MKTPRRHGNCSAKGGVRGWGFAGGEQTHLDLALHDVVEQVFPKFLRLETGERQPALGRHEQQAIVLAESKRLLRVAREPERFTGGWLGGEIGAGCTNGVGFAREDKA